MIRVLWGGGVVRIRTISLILASLILISCKPANDSINVVGNSWLGYQPFYVQNLLYPEQQPKDLHITMLVSDVSVVRMLTNQAAAVGMLSLDNAISINSRTDLNFCIALAMSSSEGADAVLMHPKFEQQLAGTGPIRVGMEDSALARHVLSRWVELKNIDSSRIQRKILLPNGHISALHQNNFDIVITYAPFTERLEQAGAIPLFTSAEIPGEIIDTLIVREETWARAQKSLTAFVTDVWDQALTQATSAGSPSYTAMAQLAGLTEPDLAKAYSQLKFYSAQASRDFLRDRYGHVHHAVVNHLLDAGMHTKVKPLPVCEGLN